MSRYLSTSLGIIARVDAAVKEDAHATGVRRGVAVRRSGGSGRDDGRAKCRRSADAEVWEVVAFVR
jgi:hypothetical protein